MKYKPVRDRCCQNEKCQNHGKFCQRNIIGHSKYKTKQGRRRRYLCKTCKKTFCSTKGTPYYRLHKTRSDFMDTCNTSWAGQKTTQLLGNLHGIGDNFLVVVHVFENSGPSREVYVDFGLVTTVA